MQRSAKIMQNLLKLLRKRFFDIFASVYGPEDVSNGVEHHVDAYIWKKNEIFPLEALSLLECKV